MQVNFIAKYASLTSLDYSLAGGGKREIYRLSIDPYVYGQIDVCNSEIQIHSTQSTDHVFLLFFKKYVLQGRDVTKCNQLVEENQR